MTTPSPRPIAWIIGGTRGLGLALAKEYLSLGTHDVVASGRNVGDLAAHGFAGAHAKTLRIDLGEPGVTDIDFSAIYDGADTLVYAAGIGQHEPLAELDPVELNRIIQVNLTAPARIVQSLLAHQRRLARLVVVTSTSARTARKDEPVYCASKAGLDMLARSFALDGRIGQTIIVAPGGMRTGFWHETDRDTAGWMDPADVAKAIGIARFDDLGPRVRIDIPRATPPVATVSEF
jgi:NAD(P)-dependent dehydrogenase (short-subunit alcohol dehydrogenase family)